MQKKDIASFDDIPPKSRSQRRDNNSKTMPKKSVASFNDIAQLRTQRRDSISKTMPKNSVASFHDIAQLRSQRKDSTTKNAPGKNAVWTANGKSKKIKHPNFLLEPSQRKDLTGTRQLTLVH
jgi:hypothetical protein